MRFLAMVCVLISCGTQVTVTVGACWSVVIRFWGRHTLFFNFCFKKAKWFFMLLFFMLWI